MFEHFRLGGDISAKDWNAAMARPLSALATKSLLARGDFDASTFFAAYSRNHLNRPPTVRDTIKLLEISGIAVQSMHIPFDVIRQFTPPLLVYLNADEDRELSEGFAYVHKLGSSRALLGSNEFDRSYMDLDELEKRWSGIVIILREGDSSCKREAEIQSYRKQTKTIDGFLSEEECNELIDICENARFRRSAVVRGVDGGIGAVVDTAKRSSCSVSLHDRNNELLSRIYQRCSELENVPVECIETVQGVRYKKGQKFKPHFDAGSVPRLTTYLLYLNEDFSGGETAFPALRKKVKPKQGAALRFPGCDLDGKILWQSYHGGMPITDGRKYALNVWVRTPEQAKVGIQLMRTE